MTGGSNTHAGIVFQDEVAAWIAVHVLAGRTALTPWGLPSNISLTTVRLETEEPVDDILAHTSSGGVCVVNAKTKVNLSNKGNSELGSVIDQFVRQWHAGVPDSGTPESHRPVDPSRDRLILAVSPDSSKRLITNLNSVIQRIIDLGVKTTQKEVAKTHLETEVYNTVCGLMRNSWNRYLAAPSSVEDLHTLMSCVRVQVFALDRGGADRNTAHTYLESAIISSSDKSANAWDTLSTACADFAKRRSGAGRTRLKEILREKGIPLLSAPEYAGDIKKVQAYSNSTIHSLSHLAELIVPSNQNETKVVVSRDCANSLCDSVGDESVLVIGDPGAGKSGALYQTAKQLTDNGWSIIQLAVDRLPISTLGSLDRELGLENRFLDVLANWESERPGILFIDALDATRGGPAERVFRDLIRAIVQELPNWNVVASIRTFDLRYSKQLSSLFQGPPISNEFASDEFKNIRHINIPKFSDEELSTIWGASPQLADIYRGAKTDLKELIQVPFNLFLLSEILRAGHDPDSLTQVVTRAELLSLYWDYRVIGQDRLHHQRQILLKGIAEKIIAGRASLSVKQLDVISAELAPALNFLLSENVLKDQDGPTNLGRTGRIMFSHHVIFDYTVAHLVLDGGRAPDFAERLNASEDSALMLAPAALLALRDLWLDDPNGHHDFWEIALELSSNNDANAISRMLAPRASVDWTKTIDDVAAVISFLGDSTKTVPAIFLINNIIGTILVDVLGQEELVGPEAGPWTLFAKQLAEIDSDKVPYPTRALISKLLLVPIQPTDDQLTDINTAACALLNHALDAEQYDGSIINPSIESVAKSIAADVPGSVQTLGRLLEKDHFNKYADKEFFWLVHQDETLLEHAPEFLVRVYGAIFGTAAPSRNEISNMGDSRILSFTSTRSQDYEMVQYKLAEMFQNFVERHPSLATEALILAVEGHVALKEGHINERQSIRIGNIDGCFQSDFSGIWWNSEDEDSVHDDAVKILIHYVNGMDAVASNQARDAEVTRVIECIFCTNRLAAVWAALLRVAIMHPRQVGLKIVELIKLVPVLESIDTRTLASKLLTILHPKLDEDQRREIEDTVLNLEDKNSRDAIIGKLTDSNLVSEDAKSLLARLKASNSIPTIAPPHSFTVGWTKSDDDWWLKKEGVDLAAEPNKSVKALIDKVENLTPPEGEGADRRAYLVEIWNEPLALVSSLRAHKDIPTALQMHGWDTLAEICGKAAKSSKTVEGIKSFPGIEEMTLEALTSDESKPDDDAENRFEESPSWGRPSPRVSAAQTIMALALVKGKPDSRLQQIIRNLVEDPAPSVRYQVISWINALCVSDPLFMWSLCEIIFEQEKNRGILRGFISAFSKIMRDQLNWSTDQLVTLSTRFSNDDSNTTNELRRSLAVLINRLWMNDDQAAAQQCMETWFADVLRYRVEISRVLTDLRDAITLGTPDNPTERHERIRKQAVAFFQQAANLVAPSYTKLAFQTGKLSGPDREEAESALKLLDKIALEIYFGSSAHEIKGGAPKPGHDVPLPAVQRRFLEEMEPTLQTLGTIQHPSVTHHLLETLASLVTVAPEKVFDLISNAMLSGGIQGGYHRESLGSKLFVDLIQLYLADHRDVLMANSDRRSALIECLNLFVESGWPDARRLVYDLPSMLR